MDISVILLVALILDYLLGEPRRWHPLVGFGQWAQRVERQFNHPDLPATTLIIRGGFSLALLVLPLTVVTAYISYSYNTYYVFDIFILYLTLGARSLIEHAQRVAHALLLKRMQEARTFTSYLVSRDTETMTEVELSRATIESTLENGNDAIFAPLLWFAIGGAPLALLYRLCNTLDAMWGYKTIRYLHFGWAAARFDDVLNYLPARLTALTYACLGHFQMALQCWRTQAHQCKSPNAGPVISSGAGTLALQLGGPTMYHGKLEDCPRIGWGKHPCTSDITRATCLVKRSIEVWLFMIWLLIGGYYAFVCI